MKSFNSYISEEEKVKKGKEVSVGKNTVKINPDSEELKEVAPPGAKYERMVKHIKKGYSKDGELTKKEKGIAYATAWKAKGKKEDYDVDAANQLWSEVGEKLEKLGEMDGAKFKVIGEKLDPVGKEDKDQKEGYAPGDVDQKVGAVTAIPQSERDAAKARLLAKTKAIRDKKKIREELEIEEGLDMKTFKANRKKNERKAASADAEKRGHVGKEWHNTGRKYSPDEAKSRRASMSDDDRAARHRAAVDPDDDRDENTYSADRTKNPKKQRKQAAMGEAMSFSDFMEARRMDKEGVDRGDSRRAERADKARASLAAKQKRQSVLDAHEKKTGTKLDISRSKEGKEHAKNFPGSRQKPKVKGAKETPLETHNRRVNRQVDRVVKHGHTSKEKKEVQAMAKHTSRFD